MIAAIAAMGEYIDPFGYRITFSGTAAVLISIGDRQAFGQRRSIMATATENQTPGVPLSSDLGCQYPCPERFGWFDQSPYSASPNFSRKAA